jgi:HK97 family phage prohead protease
MADIIVRTLSSDLETRASGASSGDGLTLTGYAAKFNSPTEIRDWSGTFIEQIAPGAFGESLQERTPIMQYQHGRDPAVGTVPIGSFTEIREDAVGLKVTARLHDTPSTHALRAAITSGAITGMSFKFEVTGEFWRDNTGRLLTPRETEDLLWRPGDRGPLTRTLTSVRLYEAGPVATPAYRDTTVGLRTDTPSADIHRLNLLVLKGLL